MVTHVEPQDKDKDKDKDLKQNVWKSQNSQLTLDHSSGHDQSCTVSTKSRTVAQSLPLLPPHARTHARTHAAHSKVSRRGGPDLE